MATIKTLIKQNAVLTYFILTFAISWGGFVIVLGPGNIPLTTVQFETLGPLVYLMMLAGPSIAGLLMSGFVSGRVGLHELLARLLKWRVGARWYAVALLTAPLLTLALNFALALLSPNFLPAIVTTGDRASLLLFGIVVAFLFGICEELGWTGFATPMLRQRYSILATGIFIGVVWGAWHFLLFWESDTFSGALPLALLCVRLFSWLPAYRVLMVWVYDHTESLSVTMLMHGSLVFSQLVLRPMTTGADNLIGILVWAAALWIIVAIVAVTNGGHLSRQTLQRQVA